MKKSAIVLGLLLLAAPLLRAADGATITYRRAFKGSVPEYIEVNIGDQGKSSYDIRRLSEEPGTAPLEVSPEARAKIFELAARQRNFEKVDFDAHRKVANTGEKTFRYAKGSEIHETKFNYTENRDAVELVNICEGIAQRQQDWDRIESRLKYDRLGVNDALRQFEVDLDKGILTDPALVLPALDRIAADSRVIDTARQRARTLAGRLRPATPSQN